MTFQTAALDLINNERRSHTPPRNDLLPSTTLQRVATDGPFASSVPSVGTVHGRCRDMGERNYFSHTIKDCAPLGFSQMLAAAGIVFSGSGENLAFVSGVNAGQEEAMASNIHGQLMADPGHAANILNPAWTHVGIGTWVAPPGVSWTGAGLGLPRVLISTQIFAGNPNPVDVGAAPLLDTGASYHPVTPSRILDTRLGAPLGAGAVVEVQVTGSGGVPPAGVSAVMLNVTVTDPSTGSFLTAFPTGEPKPDASNLNYTAGLIVANAVVVKLGAGGKVSLFNANGTVNVIVDVAGWFDGVGGATGSLFHPVSPSRIADTRTAAPLGANTSMDLPVLGRGGLPETGVAGVVANLTATQTTAPSFLTVYPAGQPRPVASNLNFTAGKTVSNLVAARLGAGGSLSVFNLAGTAQVIADVAGWFDQGNTAGGSLYHPVTPARILDTRRPGFAALGANATLDLQVTGAGGVPPAGVAAVALNVTVAGPTAPSFLTVFPTGDAKPNASNLNFVAGQVVANLVIAKLGGGGRLTFFNLAGSTHVIVDVAGWFAA
jgi:hypothetical protein